MEVRHTYSFTALFEDGTLIEANHLDPDGHNCLTRDDGTGSRFTDVQEHEKTSKLVSFVVHNENLSWGVDLRDGHFEIGGVLFWQHRPDLEYYKDFRVIYYRTTVQQKNQVTGEEKGYVGGYGLGWQVNHNGQNVQKILYIT